MTTKAIDIRMDKEIRWARILLIIAAFLWSLSSFFIRLFTEPTFLHTDTPQLTPLHIAFFRAVFAGLALSLLLKKQDIRYRPQLPFMMITFAVMTSLYLIAASEGSSANAIFLQNTAPIWVCILAWLILKERTDQKTLLSMLIAVVGGAVIVVGNWPANGGNQSKVLIMATGSGVGYAGVILFLRVLRNESAVWLTMLNLLGTALCIGLFMLLTLGPGEFWTWLCLPTKSQLFLMAIFGIMQLAVAYICFSTGLKRVSPQEAGIITLLEPLLNPIWAYLIAPDREAMTIWTITGGILLLTAMLMRYINFGKNSVSI